MQLLFITSKYFTDNIWGNYWTRLPRRYSDRWHPGIRRWLPNRQPSSSRSDSDSGHHHSTYKSHTGTRCRIRNDTPAKNKEIQENV